MFRAILFFLLLITSLQMNAQAPLGIKLDITFIDSMSMQMLDSVRITFLTDGNKPGQETIIVNKKLVRRLRRGNGWTMKVERSGYQTRVYPYVNSRSEELMFHLFAGRKKKMVVIMKPKPVVRLVEVTEN